MAVLVGMLAVAAMARNALVKLASRTALDRSHDHERHGWPSTWRRSPRPERSDLSSPTPGEHDLPCVLRVRG
jgi:hypothetical protein